MNEDASTQDESRGPRNGRRVEVDGGVLRGGIHRGEDDYTGCLVSIIVNDSE